MHHASGTGSKQGKIYENRCNSWENQFRNGSTYEEEVMETKYLKMIITKDNIYYYAPQRVLSFDNVKTLLVQDKNQNMDMLYTPSN